MLSFNNQELFLAAWVLILNIASLLFIEPNKTNMHRLVKVLTCCIFLLRVAKAANTNASLQCLQLYGIFNNASSSQIFTDALQSSSLQGKLFKLTRNANLCKTARLIQKMTTDFSENKTHFVFTDFIGIQLHTLKETLLHLIKDNNTSNGKIYLNDEMNKDDYVSFLFYILL